MREPEWWQLSPPKTNAERFERLAVDELYFGESYCSVVSYRGTGLERFTANQAQLRYYYEVWNNGVHEDIVGKSRKWGFSTFRLLLGLHNCMYMPGRIFRVVAHREKSANELNQIIKTLYESAWGEFAAQGLDPHYFLPRIVSDTALGYKFATKSQVIVETSASEGVGQGDRTDDLYCTEYSDWRHAEDKFTGLDGSHPIASPFNRTTLDFNAHGKHGDAYVKYENARKPESDPEWNGFVAFFAGVGDCPDLYTPEFLEKKRKSLGDRFPEVYPSNDREMWLASELAVFNAHHLDAAESKGVAIGYTGKVFEGREVKDFAHGVDTATGVPGKDFQAAVSLGRVDESLWGEVAPPIHGHWDEPVFARSVDKRVREFTGVCVIERNAGALVISTCRDLNTPNLYRHRSRDKAGNVVMEFGYPMTRPSKRIAIGDVQNMLADGELAITSTALMQQLRDYEWKFNEDGSEADGLAGNPSVAGKHDDLVSALLMAVQGLHRPQLQFAAVG